PAPPCSLPLRPVRAARSRSLRATDRAPIDNGESQVCLSLSSRRRRCTMRSSFSIRQRASLKRFRQRPFVCHPVAEQLEDRRLLSTTFTQTNLVSDIPG